MTNSVIKKLSSKDYKNHTLVLGPAGCGKTFTVLKPLVRELLLQKKSGVPLGLSVISREGELASYVNQTCKELGIPLTYVDSKESTDKYNPMEGEVDEVVDKTVAVLSAMFGTLDSFFAKVQESLVRNVTKLLKELYEDDVDIFDVINAIRHPKTLEERIALLKKRDGKTDLVSFFEDELFNDVGGKYERFTVGVRVQLGYVGSNEALRKIMEGKSSIDFDKHLETGGVLALGLPVYNENGVVGKFAMQDLQNAMFRRKDKSIPHYIIADEALYWLNPDTGRFLSLALAENVVCVFTVQSLGQLEMNLGYGNTRTMKQSIMDNCRNKIVFDGVSKTDERYYSRLFGYPNLDALSYLPRFAFIHELTKNGVKQGVFTATAENEFNQKRSQSIKIAKHQSRTDKRTRQKRKS